MLPDAAVPVTDPLNVLPFDEIARIPVTGLPSNYPWGVTCG